MSTPACPAKSFLHIMSCKFPSPCWTGVHGRWLLKPDCMDTKYTLRERVAGQFSAPVDYFLVSRQRHLGLLASCQPFCRFASGTLVCMTLEPLIIRIWKEPHLWLSWSQGQLAIPCQSGWSRLRRSISAEGPWHSERCQRPFPWVRTVGTLSGQSHLCTFSEQPWQHWVGPFHKSSWHFLLFSSSSPSVWISPLK